MTRRICQVTGCGKKHYARGYCERHYRQIQGFGRIFGNPERSLRDKNEYIIEGKICRIQLYDIHGFEKAEAIIDKKDFERVRHWKWTELGNGYIGARFSTGTIKLHHIILGISPRKGIEVDHRNGKPYDNRRANLRVCKPNQNKRNLGISKNNTSGFKGVTWDKDRQRWRAQIGFNWRQKYLGLFESKIPAAKVYNEAALRLHGEFARLNEIPEKRGNK